MKIHVKIQNKTYEANVGDIHSRPIQVSIDRETFEVWPEEMILPHSQEPATPTPAVMHPVKTTALQADKQKSSHSSEVTAPIPGVITAIKVNEGDAVTYGQELCVLEAMKMKNSIRASHDGTIARIHITVGEQVQQSKVLMEFSKKAD
jgi:biotin carboxyl carrier protein